MISTVNLFGNRVAEVTMKPYDSTLAASASTLIAKEMSLGDKTVVIAVKGCWIPKPMATPRKPRTAETLDRLSSGSKVVSRPEATGLKMLVANRNALPVSMPREVHPTTYGYSIQSSRRPAKRSRL